MADVVMPRLSDSMEEGTILQWLKGVGDEVAVGDELVEIETDKANMAYESDTAGTLSEILVQEGETVAIGTPIARVGDSGEARDAEGSGSAAAGPVGGEESAPSLGFSPGEQSSLAESEGRKRGRRVGADSSPPPPADDGNGARPKASPIARRIAKEKGVDLARLEGSGPGGRIIKVDVEQAEPDGERAAQREAAPVPQAQAVEASGAETAKGHTSYEDLSKTQQVIARRMSESKATAPHFYLRASVDMSRAVAGRALLKDAAGEGEVIPSFNDMVVKACALALREQPRANGACRDGRFELYSRVNVGVAVAAEDALVVPTVFDADRKGLRQIAEDSRALAQRVRDGQITPPELSGATFTVSNLGMYGIEGFSAVINPPQAAILAVGAIEERPVVRGGEIAAAHLMEVDLACDHRILYGAPAAEFLARVRALLEEPLSLAL
jgi:pyruvate dehydrogenase E2 component (dihydrolipoamide acetyltransferase)